MGGSDWNSTGDKKQADNHKKLRTLGRHKPPNSIEENIHTQTRGETNAWDFASLDFERGRKPIHLQIYIENPIENKHLRPSGTPWDPVGGPRRVDRVKVGVDRCVWEGACC